MKKHTYKTRSFQDAETFCNNLLARHQIVPMATQEYSKRAKCWVFVLTWRA